MGRAANSGAPPMSLRHKDLIICEFEREDDEVNPLNVEGLATSAVPADTLGIVPQISGAPVVGRVKHRRWKLLVS